MDHLAFLATDQDPIPLGWSRDEVRQQIWCDGTFVDFDQGLNFCIRQIREALADDAEAPYIETLPRRGYRFLPPVDVEAAGGGAPVTRPIVLPFRMSRPDPEMDFLAFSLPDAISEHPDCSNAVVRAAWVATWTANWARRNHSGPNPIDAVAAPDVTRVEYTSCADVAAVVLDTIKGGGHTWPAASQCRNDLSGPRAASIDATSQMWAFFREHPLRRK